MLLQVVVALNANRNLITAKCLSQLNNLSFWTFKMMWIVKRNRLYFKSIWMLIARKENFPNMKITFCFLPIYLCLLSSQCCRTFITEYKRAILALVYLASILSIHSQTQRCLLNNYRSMNIDFTNTEIIGSRPVITKWIDPSFQSK